MGEIVGDAYELKGPFITRIGSAIVKPGTTFGMDVYLCKMKSIQFLNMTTAFNFHSNIKLVDFYTRN